MHHIVCEEPFDFQCACGGKWTTHSDLLLHLGGVSRDAQRAAREDTERPFRSVSEFESAMFPEDVKRKQREAESPSDAGHRCAEETLEFVRDTEEGHER